VKIPVVKKTAKLLLLAFFLMYVAGKYNTMVGMNINVESSWAEVINQYTRRDALIPNMVEVTKGEAGFERSTLTAVTEARAKATSITLTPQTLNDPNAMAQFQKYQGDITTAMSRLMVASERYPELKSNQAFRDLRVQWEGTENRLAVARNRANKVIAEYNTYIATFPNNLIAGIASFTKKEQLLQNAEQVQQPIRANFNEFTKQ
jgi:LemA protein